MNYVVLARKWRPMLFEDLVGQEHVRRTLQNAIESRRIAHAYLFTGVRGVGKTTAARILAKALNCQGVDGTAEGPQITPCLKCRACREIAAGTDVDVREIDGASYNGVDEVRKLQDALPYRPAHDRYKLFIVDEVHMLSQSAWNAFLKTLEEPPDHVKFIFATTEVHKVPVTILSRVQRFDFKLIATKVIAQRLKHVLTEEGIQAEDAALSIIAREAAGSMRDAMSLLDQVIAYDDKSLQAAAVARVLGVASRQVLHDIASALVGGDAATCLMRIGGLADQGYDIPTLARDLLALLRDLVVTKVCPDPGELLDLADEEQADARALAATTTTDDLIRLHQGFSQSFDSVVRGSQPRAALEMLLTRLATRPALMPLDELVDRLSALERRLGAGGGPGPSGPGGGAPRTGRREGPASPRPRREALPEPSRARREPAPPPPVPAEHDAPADSVSSASMETWTRLVNRVRGERPELAACLQHATPRRVTAEAVVLAFEAGSLFEKTATAKDSVALLLGAAEAEFGSRPKLSFEHLGRGEASDTLSAAATREREEQRKAAEQRARSHPFIEEVTSVLGARLKEIRLAED